MAVRLEGRSIGLVGAAEERFCIAAYFRRSRAVLATISSLWVVEERVVTGIGFYHLVVLDP